MDVIKGCNGILLYRGIDTRQKQNLSMWGFSMRELSYEELLVMDLQSIPERKQELETIADPAWLHLRKRQLADLERLLDHLEENDRFLIEELVINRKQARFLTQQTEMTVQSIYAARQQIIMKLCSMRYGAVYHP